MASREEELMQKKEKISHYKRPDVKNRLKNNTFQATEVFSVPVRFW
jgi:hypothetical protein